jgi:ribosome maturation factor RimP
MTGIEPFSAPVGTHETAKMFSLLDLVNPSGYYRVYDQGGLSPTFFIVFIPTPFRIGDKELKLDPRVSDILERVITREGMEFVHAEMTGGTYPTLRIYIDKPGGVTLDDCASVSQRIGLILDVEDVIPHQYTLEVASPGLDRGLYKEADYERFAGLPTRIRISEAIDGQRNFHGKLIGLDREGEAPAVVIEEQDGKRRRLPLANIVKANVEIEP